MAEQIVMGMDGENTSCRVMLAYTAGEVLGYGQSGPVSVDGVYVESATRHIREAADAAWQDTGHLPHPIQALFWGIAGTEMTHPKAPGNHYICASELIWLIDVASC